MINIAGVTNFPISLICFVLLGCGNENFAVTDPPEELPAALATEATYVGAGQCAECHKDQTAAWQGSHHQMAMQVANSNSVLGDFSGIEFKHREQATSFYLRDHQYYVRTDGPDGNTHEYPVAYTFGIHPLQQYLIELDGGRLQALSIAWDSRAKSQGGQRWFHLYPDQRLDHQHPLHWTALDQNWNFMCADCHSTNLHKNYDLKTNSYQTTWSDINVGCEACHGPGSRHLQWAMTDDKPIQDKGLTITLANPATQNWAIDAQTGIAKLDSSTANQRELETCAQCHSRRSTHIPGAQAGGKLLDHFNLALLQAPLYHADGQPNGEVFVYGSFLQSKMYAAGVTCSHCHNPHSVELRASVDTLCSQCHSPERFAAAEHHFHPPQSTGSRCVNCHMPAKNFMQVDGRRDHSFRIPRPDLSTTLNTPNACSGCHQDKSSQWAAKILQQKFGAPENHYGQALHAGLHGDLDAEKKLLDLIQDVKQPIVARASAIRLIPDYLTAQSAQRLVQIAQEDEPLLGLALAQSLDQLPEQLRLMVGVPLLFDQMEVTRSLTANALTSAAIEQLPEDVQWKFSEALASYVASERFNSDRPESLVNLASLHAQRGNTAQAEAFYRKALSIATHYTPAYINFADFYRVIGREADAEGILQQALGKAEDTAVIQHALGLSFVRQGRHEEAMPMLKASAENKQAQSRYIYVYAIAVHSAGNPDQALNILETGFNQFPQNPDIIHALISIGRESGNLEIARKYEQLIRSQ
ncbi:tetratricopeptide repeat protein [Microbulbifer sp. OS29]|uniref:Tetratricopeptide repeat protein n=1 Tax=Microbulbifer okhotskensis TaxID=2926617 RepID=A0A9X2EM39_9GAMM|nr:tetratricopeptide repeat protein [Microbulbifer okhotskensis]MCO1334762.1 tetratricopeptide repeat protein [Microbulbifer okhotskensis]